MGLVRPCQNEKTERDDRLQVFNPESKNPPIPGDGDDEDEETTNLRRFKLESWEHAEPAPSRSVQQKKRKGEIDVLLVEIGISIHWMRCESGASHADFSTASQGTHRLAAARCCEIRSP